jgi:hypothetical protein
MRRRIATLGLCGALVFSLGASGASAGGDAVAKASCTQLSKKYYKALDAGHGAKAGRIRQKMVNKGCQNLPPPAIPSP